jgi:hypothetical protein
MINVSTATLAFTFARIMTARRSVAMSIAKPAMRPRWRIAQAVAMNTGKLTIVPYYITESRVFLDNSLVFIRVSDFSVSGK